MDGGQIYRKKVETEKVLILNGAVTDGKVTSFISLNLMYNASFFLAIIIHVY